jgi:hypothetical protein
MEPTEVEVIWRGPYAWPGTESPGQESIPKEPGVYLLTVEYQDGYLIYAAGITSRPIAKRLREHTREYQNGVYNVLDIDAMRNGERKEVWHGFWMKPRSSERIEEFNARREEIVAIARRQMQGFRVFVCAVPAEGGRVKARIEAAIMSHLYTQPPPYNAVPDKGMFLAPRRVSESPITLRSRCSAKLHCLPGVLVI